MFLMIIANILGIALLFFFLWRSLKEDYQFEKNFNLAFITLFGFLFGSIVSHYIFKEYWFWIIVVSSFTFFSLSIVRQKMSFFEAFEGFVVGGLSWVSLVFLTDSINKSNLYSFILFWISLFCVALFFFFKNFYRTFNWYKSGRVGFAGVATASLFFLFRALYSFFVNTQVFSIVNNLDVYLSGAVAIIFFLLLYKLSISKR